MSDDKSTPDSWKEHNERVFKHTIGEFKEAYADTLAKLLPDICNDKPNEGLLNAFVDAKRINELLTWMREAREVLAYTEHGELCIGGDRGPCNCHKRRAQDCLAKWPILE